MDGGNLRHTLLEGETAEEAAAGGGYAPPTSSQQQQPQQPQQQPQQEQQQQQLEQPGERQEIYDLRLTVTGEDGVPIVGGNDQDGYQYPNDGPELPPLVSYCSYVKFAWAFGKWPLLVAIFNAIILVIVLMDDYFDRWTDNGRPLMPFNSWKGLALAGIWFSTAIWFYVSARIVERDVLQYDQMVQYQLQPGTEVESGDSNSSSTFHPNFTAIYGQVSRKLDAVFSKTSPTQQPTSSETSSLVSASFALCSLALAGAVFLLLGSALGKMYQGKCEIRSSQDGNSKGSGSNSGSNSSKFDGDFSDIDAYPSGVQEWITVKTDPFAASASYAFYDDDYYMPTYSSQFPVAFEVEEGATCQLSDSSGTLIFAGQKPYSKEEYTDDETHRLVLVEVTGSGSDNIEVTYHEDLIHPRMFLPVGSDLSKDEDGIFRASNCCFVATDSDAANKEKQRTWKAIIRTSNVYCAHKSSDSSKLVIQNALVAWTDKSQKGPRLQGASSNGQLLISHTGINYRYFQEVVAVTPMDDSLSQEFVYHKTFDGNGGWDGYDIIYDEGYDYGGRSSKSRCIQDHVIILTTMVTLVVLVTCGLWLLIREGTPAGVVPIVYAAVTMIYALAEAARPSYSYYYGVGDGWIGLVLSLGVFFFHAAMCCADSTRRGWCPCLPTWVNREMYCWALYSWIISLIVLDLIAGEAETVVFLGLVSLAVTGIILDHPILAVMGGAFITSSFIILLIIWPMDGFDSFDVAPIFFTFIFGMGMISVGKCFSNNRRRLSSICRPLSQACSTIFFGRSNSSNATSAPAAIA